MTREKLPLELIKQLTPEVVRAYAEKTGWKEVFDNVEIAIYNSLRHSFSQLLVPLNMKFGDYTKRIEECVHDLAEEENISAMVVLGQLFLSAGVSQFELYSPRERELFLRAEKAEQKLERALKVHGLILSEFTRSDKLR